MLRPYQISRILKRLNSPKWSETWLKKKFPIKLYKEGGIAYYSYDEIWGILAYCKALKMINLDPMPRMNDIAEFCEQALTSNRPYAIHRRKREDSELVTTHEKITGITRT